MRRTIRLSDFEVRENRAGYMDYHIGNMPIFFNLQKDKQATAPVVRMFVKSAYLKPLMAKSNAQNWRFASLAGQIAEAFPPREKRPKPAKKKKKAPQSLVSAS